jgi:DNA-binding PadR family transcriptional regulator
MSKDFWSGFGLPGEPPWTGFAFGRGARFFEAGEIRLAILSLLSEGPKHGYQLMKEMSERSGGVYKASAGTVYPTLQQLEDEELIASDQQGGKRIYHLTPEGLRELERDPGAVRRIWERTNQFSGWDRIMTPGHPLFPALGQVIKAAIQAARRAGPDRVRVILERTRKQLEEL